jgi:hypothetical protein
LDQQKDLVLLGNKKRHRLELWDHPKRNLDTSKYARGLGLGNPKDFDEGYNAPIVLGQTGGIPTL